MRFLLAVDDLNRKVTLSDTKKLSGKEKKGKEEQKKENEREEEKKVKQKRKHGL